MAGKITKVYGHCLVRRHIDHVRRQEKEVAETVTDHEDVPRIVIPLEQPQVHAELPTSPGLEEQSSLTSDEPANSAMEVPKYSDSISTESQELR